MLLKTPRLRSKYTENPTGDNGKKLNEQTIKYAKHFSAVLDNPCTVEDLTEQTADIFKAAGTS